MRHHLLDGTILVFVGAGCLILGRPLFASFIGILGAGLLLLR